MRADNRTNIAYLMVDYLALGLVLAGETVAYGAWTTGRLSTGLFVGCAALGITVVAAIQHRLSGLGHEAGHYTMFRNKLANELASDFLCMFPLMAMTQRFRATHLGHHRFVNDPVKDPDWSRLHAKESDHFPMSKPRFWGRYVLEAFWPLSLWTYLFSQARNANATAGQPEMRTVYRFRVGRCLRGAYWLTVLTAVHLAGLWPIFWLFWVLPLLTVYPFFMQLREIAHHSNAPDDGEFTNSRIFRVNPIVRACVFPYGQDFHLTHHLFAMLPHYRMAEAHTILMNHRPYREQVVICQGFFFRTPGTDGPSILDVLSRPVLSGSANTSSISGRSVSEAGATPPAPAFPA
jgi:fatty acid desaturase